MPNPRKDDAIKYKPVSYSFPPGFAKVVKEAAKARGVTASEFVRQVLEDHLMSTLPKVNSKV